MSDHSDPTIAFTAREMAALNQLSISGKIIADSIGCFGTMRTLTQFDFASPQNRIGFLMEYLNLDFEIAVAAMVRITAMEKLIDVDLLEILGKELIAGRMFSDAEEIEMFETAATETLSKSEGVPPVFDKSSFHTALLKRLGGRGIHPKRSKFSGDLTGYAIAWVASASGPKAKPH